MDMIIVVNIMSFCANRNKRQMTSALASNPYYTTTTTTPRTTTALKGPFAKCLFSCSLPSLLLMDTKP